MPAQQNHYQILGLDLSATNDQIRDALRQLGEQADGLAYSSPERSRELWARIRQIKGDLLSSSERRYAYDCNVVDGWGADAETSQIPIPTPRAAVPLVAAGPTTETARQPFLPWFLASAAGLMAFALILAWLVNRHPAHHGSVTAVALTAAGTRSGSLFTSGTAVTLRWSQVTNAAIYRLQVARSSGAPGTEDLFAHPWRTVLTYQPQYRFTVLGQQAYVWRVQAFVDGRWAAPTQSTVFGVEAPRIAAPSPVLPTDKSVTTSQRVRLCWNPVPGAAGYHLRIRGIGGMNVQGTCRTETLQPDLYRWTVAALARGVHIYIGAYSRRMYFTVQPKVRHELAARRVHRSRRAQVHTSGRAGAPLLAAILRPASTPSRSVSRSVAAVTQAARTTGAPVRSTGSASTPRMVAAVTLISSRRSTTTTRKQRSSSTIPRWVPVPRATVAPAPKPPIALPPPAVPTAVQQPVLPPPPPSIRVERTYRVRAQSQRSVNIYSRTPVTVSVGRSQTTTHPTAPVLNSTGAGTATRAGTVQPRTVQSSAQPSPTPHSHPEHGSKR